MSTLRLLLFLCFSGFMSAKAQVNYSFSASSGSYTPISGTSPVINGINPGYEDIDEGYANDIPLPFSFNYNGTVYTSISANTNGFASFKPFTSIADTARYNYWQSDLNAGPYAPAGPVANRPVLAPLWDDLELSTSADLQYSTAGNAPSRVFTLQWSQVYWTLEASQPSIEFQIKLYEGSNRIEFVYNQLSGSVEGAPFASIGITGEGTGSGQFLSLSNSSSSPTASSTVNTYSINTRPASGQVYTFTPLAALPVTMSRFDVAKTGCNIDVAFTSEQEKNVDHYMIEFSKDGSTFSTLGEIAALNAQEYTRSFPITESIKAPSLFVRVKTLDKDGRVEYSAVRKISGECDQQKGFVLGLYPNPLTAASQFTVVSKEGFFNGRYKVLVIDMFGHIVLSKQLQLNNTSSFNVNVGNISSGGYLLKVTNEAEAVSAALHFNKN